MSNFNELYERTLSRLLTDHTAKAVPPDLDLWPAIQQRLVEREGAAELATEQEQQSGLRASVTPLPIQPHPATGGRVRRLWRSASALVGVATFALLAIITTLAISGLANRANRVGPSQASEEGLVFSIPYSENGIQSAVTGFDIDENGVFWIADTSERILRFTTSGEQMKPISLSAPGMSPYRVPISDLELSVGKVWVLNDFTSITAYTIRADGFSYEAYYPSVALPPLPGRVFMPRNLSFVLRKGGEGSILLEQNGGPLYSEIRKTSEFTGTSSSDTGPAALAGYPANGKLYTKGNAPNVIMAGDVPVTIEIPDSVLNWHMLKVMPDNSFYVVVEAQVGPNSRREVTLENYIMHYGADGKLIARARIPGLGHGQQNTLMKQLAVGPDNSVYAVVTRNISDKNASMRADVLRLHFYPASQPLPPAPPGPPAPTLSPTALPPTPRPTHEIADDTSLLFSIPVGKGGIRFITSTYGASPRLGFAAAAPDGTFWLADEDHHLVHYDAKGKRLGNIPLPTDKGDPFDMRIWGETFWLYYLNPSSRNDPGTLYHLGPDGREIARYAIPEYVVGRASGLTPNFILGEKGEVYLTGDFTNLIPTAPQFPNPVPTEQMPQTSPKGYWKLVDVQGNPAAESLEGYNVGGRTYIVRLPFPHVTVNKGYIKVDDVEVDLTTTYPMTSFDLLHVKEDGSFFVGGLEDEGVGDPYILTHYTIYHYSVQGKLIARARKPMQGGRLLMSHSGDFYTIFEQPYWEGRGGEEPDKIEVRRLTFYPANQSLPPLPTAIPTTPPQPEPTPSPKHPMPPHFTATPPLPPADPGEANTGDLRDLKAKSDVVAQVRIFSYNRVPNGHFISMEVQRWLWQSTALDTKTLNLLVPDELWNKMPEAFRDDPMTQDRKQQSVYILFLTKGETIPDWGDTYTLTEGPTGAFMVLENHIQNAGIPRYNGWTADAFRDAITNAILTTPTVPTP